MGRLVRGSFGSLSILLAAGTSRLGVFDTMDRVAVFVDAGYLFAQGSIELCGQKLERRYISLNHSEVIAKLKQLAEETFELPLLRIYWYDGTAQGPTSQHNTLADQPDIKVRLGFVNTAGQQKGVDSLIVTDMITLARNKAFASCVLLSGDEDIRVGVQQAQEHGVRVHLLGIKPARGTQSLFLLREADTSQEWCAADLESFMECKPPPVEEPANNTSVDRGPVAGRTKAIEPFAGVARQVADEIPHAELRSTIDDIRQTGQRPAYLDGRLLATSRTAVGHDLDPLEKRAVREAFLAALERRMADDEERGRPP